MCQRTAHTMPRVICVCLYGRFKIGALGFNSYGGKPLIRIASAGDHQLSFWNLAELHVLAALRKYHQISPQRLRRVIGYLEDTLESEHPLLTARMLTDGVNVFIEHTKALVNASKGGQLALRQLIEAHLERIDQDTDGLAVRLFPFVRHSPGTIAPSQLANEPKIISLDPRVRFGRPVIVGTSILFMANSNERAAHRRSIWKRNGLAPSRRDRRLIESSAMRLPAVRVETCSRPVLVRRRFRWLPSQPAVGTMPVVVTSELEEFHLKVGRRPEERTVQALAPNGTDQTFNERMRART
jgi:hypothetical protein